MYIFDNMEGLFGRTEEMLLKPKAGFRRHTSSVHIFLNSWEGVYHYLRATRF